MHIERRDRPIAVLLIALIFLAGICAVRSPETPPQLTQETQTCQKCSGENEGKSPTLLGLGANEYIALFTAGTLAVLVFQMLAAFRANEHFRVTERAYVTLSHHPPGIHWIDKDRGHFDISIRVKNFGSTPAEITDILLTTAVIPRPQPIPRHPDYAYDRSMEQRSQAFLVTGDSFNYTKTFVLSAAEAQSLVQDQSQLIVFGYVDYMDKFGKRHRAGYGRFDFPVADRRQLYLTDEEWRSRGNLQVIMSRGFLYDRLRTNGEGEDWPTG